MQVKMGLFTIYDPPEAVGGHPDLVARDWIDVIVDAYKTTDFPYERLIPGMRSKGITEIKVTFSDGSDMNNSLGLYYGRGEIKLNTQYGLSGTPFTFVHELGHCVDSLTLSPAIRKQIQDFWHSFRCMYHFPDVDDPNNPGVPHIWSHEAPHSEMWETGGGSYLHRHNEAFADAFVAAFNPGWWGARGPYGRFVHWPTDYTGYDPNDYTNPRPTPISYYDKIYDLVLKEPIMAFTDVPTTHPHYEGIMWCAANGIVAGYSDGTFKPDLKVTDAVGNPRNDVKISGIITRAAQCTILKRYHDAMKAGVIP
jgi:hypothetical protein